MLPNIKLINQDCSNPESTFTIFVHSCVWLWMYWRRRLINQPTSIYNKHANISVLWAKTTERDNIENFRYLKSENKSNMNLTTPSPFTHQTQLKNKHEFDDITSKLFHKDTISQYATKYLPLPSKKGMTKIISKVGRKPPATNSLKTQTQATADEEK